MNLWERGLDLFNKRQFFECHEVLEQLWGPSQGAERLFLQAVIHFAVGFHHHQQDNPAGAERQLMKGLRKLAGYLPRFYGVDTAALYREGQRDVEIIRQGGRITCFPVIHA
ncbi:MAG: DUF309 domain-containing protein [Candidatus Solibacter usitatus]|nr:DUF309 domain-containing protein [Candidatus Solibacter usitatus]